MRKNIITACAGYHPDQLLPFFDSLERIRFDGTVHAIVWDNDTTLKSFIEQLNIRTTVFSIGKKPSRLVNRVARVLSRLTIGKHQDGETAAIESPIKSLILRNSLPISSLRYLIAQKIVRSSTNDSVFLLTDSRDVYFQTCPFEDYGLRFPATLHLSMEDRYIQPGNINHRWLVDIYGERRVAEICLSETVSCSGTTIADKTRIEMYLDSMVKEIIKYRWEISHTQGYDQGLHNYLYYGGFLSHVSNPSDGEGLFLVTHKKPKIDGAGYVVSSAGSIIPVVHQYDRNITAFQGSKLFESVSRIQQLKSDA